MSNRAFAFCADLCVFFKFGIKCLNGLMRGFDIELGHRVNSGPGFAVLDVGDFYLTGQNRTNILCQL